MELVYLSNGQECYLKEQMGNKYLVQKIFEFQDEYGNWYDISDQQEFITDTIFRSKPIAKINTEIKELETKKTNSLKEIKELEDSKRTLKYELDSIKKTITNENSFIINKNDFINAKSLAYFIDRQIEPICLKKETTEFNALKITLSVSLSKQNNKERSWGYKLYSDNNSIDYGDSICKKTGFLINPTEEEIIKKCHERIEDKLFNFSDYIIEHTENKYLTMEFIKRKEEILINKKLSEKRYLEKQILDIQNKLYNLDK